MTRNFNTNHAGKKPKTGYDFFTCKSSFSLSVKGCLRLTFLPSALKTFKKSYYQRENQTNWQTRMPHSIQNTYKFWRWTDSLSKHMNVINEGFNLFSRRNHGYWNCQKTKVHQWDKVIPIPKGKEENRREYYNPHHILQDLYSSVSGKIHLLANSCHWTDIPPITYTHFFKQRKNYVSQKQTFIIDFIVKESN